MAPLTEKQKKLIAGGVIAGGVIGLLAYLLTRKPGGEPLTGEISGSATIRIEPMTDEEAEQVQPLPHGGSYAYPQAPQHWNITIDGKRFEDVPGLNFIPTVVHKSGGIFPLRVGVMGKVDGATLGYSEGQLTLEGGSIELQAIPWRPSSEGTFTLTFTAVAEDQVGQRGEAEVTLTAVVEPVTPPPPEIELIVEVEAGGA